MSELFARFAAHRKASVGKLIEGGVGFTIRDCDAEFDSKGELKGYTFTSADPEKQDVDPLSLNEFNCIAEVFDCETLDCNDLNRYAYRQEKAELLAESMAEALGVLRYHQLPTDGLDFDLRRVNQLIQRDDLGEAGSTSNRWGFGARKGITHAKETLIDSGEELKHSDIRGVQLAQDTPDNLHTLEAVEAHGVFKLDDKGQINRGAEYSHAMAWKRTRTLARLLVWANTAPLAVVKKRRWDWAKKYKKSVAFSLKAGHWQRLFLTRRQLEWLHDAISKRLAEGIERLPTKNENRSDSIQTAEYFADQFGLRSETNASNVTISKDVVTVRGMAVRTSDRTWRRVCQRVAKARKRDPKPRKK